MLLAGGRAMQVYGVGGRRMESGLESVCAVRSSFRSTFRLGGSVFPRRSMLRQPRIFLIFNNLSFKRS